MEYADRLPREVLTSYVKSHIKKANPDKKFLYITFTSVCENDDFIEIEAKVRNGIKNLGVVNCRFDDFSCVFNDGKTQKVETTNYMYHICQYLSNVDIDICHQGSLLSRYIDDYNRHADSVYNHTMQK